ncbi:MAG: helix-turn-helix domain-containing protein [Pseudomonas sp.]
MHRVVIVVQHDVVSFDLSIPYEVFSRVTLSSGQAAYQFRVCAEHAQIETAGFGLTLRWGLEQLAEADTIIIPGTDDPSGPLSDALKVALQKAMAKGTRIASICSGSFTLAASGVLDGLRATTHWRAVSDMARLFPKVHVDPNVLFVDNGQVLTSAGAVAGLDLCLHMVRCDFGAAVAADAARLAVMSLEREGGQAQFIVHSDPESDSSLGPLLLWLDENLDQPLSLKTIAAHAAISSRTLSRRFLEQMGTTPLQWLSRARVRRAQLLLETTRFSIEQIASKAGFGSSTTLRERFQQHLCISPQGYRRGFNRAGNKSRTSAGLIE